MTDAQDDDIDEIRLDNNTLVSPEEFLSCSGPPMPVDKVRACRRPGDNPGANGWFL